MNAPADVMWPPCSPDSYRDEEGCSTSLVRFFRSVFYFTILFELFCFACSCSHFACVLPTLCPRHAHAVPTRCPRGAHAVPTQRPHFAHTTPTPAWVWCGLVPNNVRTMCAKNKSAPHDPILRNHEESAESVQN